MDNPKNTNEYHISEKSDKTDLEMFFDKFKFNYLTNENIEDICLNLKRKISIIVPIYNAYEDTKNCIESVLEHSGKDFELILINDKSTDERIDSLLKCYESNNHVKIINNPVNVGFVSSVNVGLKNSECDVILLNSDTIVTPRWIEKLTWAAYSDEKIATVTPFSNNAGVFSVPDFAKENIISNDLGLIGTSDIVEKASNHVYMRVPTGNGFCMFIKRDAIDRVGYFDESTFGKGYGEENDFCMRAVENGFENIIDDSAYIFHKGSSSFGSENQQLMEENSKLLLKKHPTYFDEVSKFLNSKTFENMRGNIANALKDSNSHKKRILHIGNPEKSIIQMDHENFFLDVKDKLSLYYLKDDNSFKIKEWDVSADEACFNIIINLAIDEVRGNLENLENSSLLISFISA